MFEPKTIIEPFRVKMVEPLPRPDQARRDQALQDARFNLFFLHAADVTVDLMTDSGTSAMSQEQWSAMLRGDESYAGARSYHRFRSVIRELTGMRHIIPTHQGRAAERILFTILARDGMAVPSNTHFDTTRANVEHAGAEALDFLIPAGSDPVADHPFKGNADVERLAAWLSENAWRVPIMVMTVTNNSCGGQPVSLENLRAVRHLLHQHQIPLFLDCARFAENAWFIKQREPGQGHRSAADIAREMFRLADGALMSAKKDGFANIGGFLTTNNDRLAAQCRSLLILTEGFPTYGGLAGRDLEAIATGLEEVLDEEYLQYRIASIEYVWQRLHDAGVPLLNPPGGHAVYIDARRFVPHIPPTQLPGQTVSVALYREAGVRTVEIGTVMFGKSAPNSNELRPADMDLVRLAMPRRVYTQSHMDYVVEACIHVFERRGQLGGFRLLDAPAELRHFTCGFEPVGWDPFAN